VGCTLARAEPHVERIGADLKEDALARELIRLGYRCGVVALSKIPRPGERIKTDRRDALSLASLARTGELVPMTIPDASTFCDFT